MATRVPGVAASPADIFGGGSSTVAAGERDLRALPRRVDAISDTDERDAEVLQLPKDARRVREVATHKATRSSHCVTIEYAGERKVDLVPCIRNRNGVTGHEVCKNFNTNAFRRSEPEAYTDWLNQRNGWTGGNGPKK